MGLFFFFRTELWYNSTKMWLMSLNSGRDMRGNGFFVTPSDSDPKSNVGCSLGSFSSRQISPLITLVCMTAWLLTCQWDKQDFVFAINTATVSDWDIKIKLSHTEVAKRRNCVSKRKKMNFSDVTKKAILDGSICIKVESHHSHRSYKM